MRAFGPAGARVRRLSSVEPEVVAGLAASPFPPSSVLCRGGRGGRSNLAAAPFSRPRFLLRRAFHACTCDKSRTLADYLVALGHLNGAQRAAVEALAALHVEAHGGDVERSLAAVPAGKPTRDGLASLGDPDIEALFGHVGSAHPQRSADEDGPDRTASMSVGSAASDGQRFRILRPHARGGRLGSCRQLAFVTFTPPNVMNTMVAPAGPRYAP